MKIINVVMIDGKEVLIDDLPEKERRDFVNRANRAAMKRTHYVEETEEEKSA